MEGMATVVAVEEEVTIVAVKETKMMIDVEEKVLTTPALGAWVLLYRWLCEARVAATRMAKLRVDGSQSFGVALRANQFLPKRGFMDYQRLPSRVAMLPMSSFSSFQAIKHFVNMVMSVVQLDVEEKTMMVAWKKRDGVVRPATTVAFYKKIREEKDKMEKKERSDKLQK
ncbi:hypothetical protein IGI04_021301 [Brassica rapa subsp. trilocularis]|uniref:Uncharacterized protein n=1 Tax=Brassica rapa subsp. trilocularis TaxID=1813537 RepID=A0ABQ7LXP0_BRACM|nr:hypothetical protein IGI04_021301 [Brassica rapa subsp. trilocularis]